jgi:hypothetical protein
MVCGFHISKGENVMFRDWFGSRTLHAPKRDRFFRPSLEFLEGRLAPSGMGPGGPPGPPANVHINNNDSFNTNTNDSFNTAVNNITVNQTFTTINNTTIQQSFQTNLILSAQQNYQAALGLVLDEFELAAETYLTLAGGQAGNPALASDMHGLQFAIQQNPLEGTSEGAMLGTLAFNVGLQDILHSQGGHS